MRAREGAHPYVWDGTTRRPAGGLGRPIRPCIVCGQGRSRHSAVKAAVAREASVSGPMPKAPTTGRRPRTLPKVPPAELVGLALAVDRILALPADLVGWRLRLRLADIRPLLNVPEFPVLAGPEVATSPSDPEAPPPTLVAARPALAPRPVAITPGSRALSIVRGIRSERIRSLARRAIEQGWDVDLTGSGHLRLSKGSQVIIGSGTGDRGRGYANLRAEAKRRGMDVSGL